VSFAARFVVALNRVFPEPIDYGTESAETHPQWEHDTGLEMYRTHFADEVPLVGRRVLDIGCGNGGKSLLYLELGARQVVALDYVEANAGKGADYALEAAATGIDFVAADGAALPFPDHSFDVITATDTFEHFPDPGAVLREMSRVLVPGGRVLFYFTPHRSPLGSHLYGLVHLPWCHLLVPRRTLFRAVEIVYERKARATGDPDPETKARGLAEYAEYFYDEHLNEMTVRRFNALVSGVDDLRIAVLKRRPLKSQLLAPLTRIPPLDELTTTLAIGVLEKD